MQLPFEKIYASDLIHPAEKEAEHECQKNSIYDWLARENAAWKNRTGERAEALLHYCPVTSKTVPRLNRLYNKVLKCLDCEEHYPLFLEWEYEIQAKVTGSNEDGYIIILSSESLEELEDAELTALLGQAVGQIKAGHSQNLRMIDLMRTGLSKLPFVGETIEKSFWSSFADWIIAAQFTTDRFALQACGSERAVASLLLKQNGLTSFDMDNVLNQHVKKSSKQGVYFFWLVHSLKHFGAIERIQELRRWIRSEKFRKDYPGFYYHLRLENDDGEISTEMNLHRAVAKDNVDAMIELAQLYMKGNENLSRSFFMVTELSKSASFFGNAKAMYLFASCLEKSDNVDKNIIQRLYEASLSRDFEQARKKVPESIASEKNIFLEEVCNTFTTTYNNQTTCKLEFTESIARKVCNAFWMNKDEKIFALEIFSKTDGSLFGTAITASGIFGRLSEKFLPFFISWSKLKNAAIQRKNNFLMCDDIKICRAESKLKGTIGELIVRLASKIQS